MQIGYLGLGCWGFCLALLLANKGFRVISWTVKKELADQLNATGEHPLFPGIKAASTMRFTTDMEEALEGAEMIVESVTSAGLRPVFEAMAKKRVKPCPIALTSKGIEQDTNLILPDVALEVLGPSFRDYIGCLSGPSYAQEVVKELPISVVASAYGEETMKKICQTFATPSFRVYPNSDIRGVAFGGALKNVIAIACGIAEGLGLGSSAKAALITRGLHEMRKVAIAKGCKAETLYGLSGMGDLCMTCSSSMSRNFRFGILLAQGLSPEEAKEKIGMVVEGAYTCLSALQLSQATAVPMPITEQVYKIICREMKPFDAVASLMQRTIKEEHL